MCIYTVAVAVWCSGSALVTINVVILHRARLVHEFESRSHPLGI